MMSFCRKSVHSFLGLTDLNCTNTNNNNYYSSNSLFESKLLSPTTTTTTTTQSNVKESSFVKLLQQPAAVVVDLFQAKKDPGGIGFIDEVGGGVDGLMSCTESLGFESSDERTVDDGIDLGKRDVIESESESSLPSPSPKWRKVGEKNKEVKKFPPPLSSFNHHGRPSFFLRPVRKNGRLELTEVRIDRPEILRAFREDGRLRLHLIRDDDDDDLDYEFKEEEEEENNQEIQQEEDKEEEEEEEEEIEDEESMEEENDEEEESVDDWKFPVSGEGFRRCNEKAHHDHHRHHHHHHHNMSHHHNLHVWSQHYVTTR